jgi:hypothetical protein
LFFIKIILFRIIVLFLFGELPNILSPSRTQVGTEDAFISSEQPFVARSSTNPTQMLAQQGTLLLDLSVNAGTIWLPITNGNVVSLWCRPTGALGCGRMNQWWMCGIPV